MRILVVLPLTPWPLDRGERMRAWDLLEELATRGSLTVLLVTRQPLGADAHTALANLADIVHVQQLATPVWSAFAGLVRGLPPAVGAYWSPRAARRMRELSQEPWDLVVAFQLRSALYALDTPANVRAIDLTDSFSMFRRALPLRGRAGLQRLLLVGVERLEARIPRAFDICWVSAADDGQVIADLSGREPTVVANGCTPVPQPPPYRPDGHLLFVGDMRYPANEDGILSFIAATWPTLRARESGCSLHIVGRPTSRVVHAAARPGIELLGPLPDITSELEAAGAVINPVNYGSGSSKKVLTAWSLAKPVISTVRGARGLTYTNGKDILIARTPHDWLEAVQWLRRNPEAAAELGRSGWMRAQRSYDARRLWAQAIDAATAEHPSAVDPVPRAVVNWPGQPPRTAPGTGRASRQRS